MGLNLGGILKGVLRTGFGAAAGFIGGGPAGAAAGGLAALARSLGGGGGARGGTNTIPAPGPIGGFGGLNLPVGFGGRGGFGGFGGAGAGGDFGPPAFGPAVPLPGVATGGLDLCGPMASMIPLQMTARAMQIPGYVVVTLPASCGGAAGQKVHVLKEVARKMGWWRPTPRALLTAGDAKCLRRSRTLENKLVRLTKRHTKYKVSVGGTRARRSAHN